MGSSVHRQTYRYYLKTDAWKRRRAEVLERDGHKCSGCGSTKSLHVHHVTYDRIFDERPEDLVTLCAGCHEKAHESGAPDPPKDPLEKFRIGHHFLLSGGMCGAAPVSGDYYCDYKTPRIGLAVFATEERSFWLHFGDGEDREHHQLGGWPGMTVGEARMEMLRVVRRIGVRPGMPNNFCVPATDVLEFFDIHGEDRRYSLASRKLQSAGNGLVWLSPSLIVNGLPSAPPRCIAVTVDGHRCNNPVREEWAFCHQHKFQGCKQAFDGFLVCCRKPKAGTNYCASHVVGRLVELEALYAELVE